MKPSENGGGSPPPPWSPERPSVLVVSCSDGRLEERTEQFLREELGIYGHDRLYLPGGPGALAGSGFEYTRVDVHRKECRFLLEAHQIREVILIFHSDSPDGPPEAMCADYLRKFPGQPTAQLRAHQEADVPELLNLVFGYPPELRVRVFRAEVGAGHQIRFVKLAER